MKRLRLQMVLLALVAIETLHAQEVQTSMQRIPYGWLGHVTAVHQGYIVTNQNDTLTGSIRISPSLNDYPVLDSATHVVRSVDLKNIIVMRVYDDSSKQTFKDWVNINYKSRPWILLAKKNGVALYENTRLYGPPLVLVTPYKRIIPFRTWGVALHRGGYDGALRRFIYRRYKIYVANFDSIGNVFTYIVDKENLNI